MKKKKNEERGRARGNTLGDDETLMMSAARCPRRGDNHFRGDRYLSEVPIAL